MAMQLVRSGFGISFLPHSIVETHPNSGIYAKPLRGIPAKSYPVLVWSDDVQGRALRAALHRGILDGRGFT